MRRQPLVALLIAAAVGICCDRYIACASLVVWGILAIVFFIAHLGCVYRSRHCSAAWCAVIFVACAMGAWHHMQWSLYPADHVVFFVDQSEPTPVRLRGTAITVPESTQLGQSESMSTLPSGVATRFSLRATQIWQSGNWSETSGTVKAWVNGHLLGVDVGDELEIVGHLSLPEPSLNPGQRDFVLLARSDRTLARLSVAYPDCVTILAHGQWSFAAWIGHVRAAGIRRLDRHVGGSHAVLAGALLMGARDRLDQESIDKFLRTGTIHLLAISGLHVGILAWLFFQAAKNSRSYRNFALLLLMLLSVIYCYVTGMRAPVLRAVILLQMVCIGLIWRRNVVGLNALAGAALVVLAVCPMDLFRTGAQLSFLAVATLCCLGHKRFNPVDPLDRLILASRSWGYRQLRRLVVRGKQLAIAGASIWLVALPLVMYRFHLVAPVSIVMNLVLAIPITLALLSGFGVLVTSAWMPMVADVCGAVCHGSLTVVETLVHGADRIPGAWFWVAGPHLVWCLLFYFGLSLPVFFSRFRFSFSWAVALFALWWTLPLVPRLIFGGTHEPELRCTFLAVGHGTCVVCELPDDRVLIYDAGRMGAPAPGVQLVSSYLWHRGIEHIDTVVISHADADHYNAVPGLIERFSVGQVIVTPVMHRDDSPGVRSLLADLRSEKVPLRLLSEMDCIRSSGVVLRALHPSDGGVAGSDNANSLVLVVEYAGRRLLLPGDLEPPGLQQVFATPIAPCDVLMAPHHGSLGSAPAEVARWCAPSWVVVSGGDVEYENHQRAIFSQFGASVLHTARCGAVTFTISPRGIHVETFVELLP